MFDFEEFVRQQVDSSSRTWVGATENWQNQPSQLDVQYNALLVEKMTNKKKLTASAFLTRKKPLSLNRVLND